MTKPFSKLIIIFIALALILSIFSVGYIANMKSHISQSLLRLHIVGATDSDVDQNLKLAVRDKILSEFSDEFSSCNSVAEAMQTADKLIPQIRQSATDQLSSLGCNADVSVNVERCPFPTKSYGSISLPSGEYTALNIKIGEATGKNWWCVMYPPLCITDKSMILSGASLESLKSTLTEQEFLLISNNKRPDIKIKFRIAEAIGKYFE